jgi:CheY-like chemotaxis protein
LSDKENTQRKESIEGYIQELKDAGKIVDTSGKNTQKAAETIMKSLQYQVQREKLTKILIIEDDPDYAELILDELDTEDIKMEIVLMRDGQEAIDYFQESVVKWDGEAQSIIKLIILDLGLPKVCGMDVLKFLKNDSRYSSIPVIILSANSDRETIKKAYENGANNYITKPGLYDDFIEKMRVLKEYILLLQYVGTK